MTAIACDFDGVPLSASRARPEVGSGAHSCAVCGSADVRTDAVEGGALGSGSAAAVLHLGECGHCEHRWTWHDEASSGSAARPGRAARPARITTRRGARSAEVASAA